MPRSLANIVWWVRFCAAQTMCVFVIGLGVILCNIPQEIVGRYVWNIRQIIVSTQRNQFGVQ